MPPLCLLDGLVDWLLALQVLVCEDTVSRLVALEVKSLLLVSFTLLRGQSSIDGVEINSAII
jgi:hypothetical protein